MDWIEDFLSYTDGVMSPEIFRLWTAIGIISGAMERRCWTQTVDILYPNLFILLVAPPGVGKTQAINHASRFWRGTKNLFVSPDSLTKASMMDTLARADRKIVTNNGTKLIEYHSIQIAAGELGVFLPAYDLEFLSALNTIYDNPDSYTEERRTNKISLNIVKPQCTILAGTQPGFMASIIPEEAWSMGTTSRFIMVYAGIAPKMKGLFNKSNQTKFKQPLRDSLQERLTNLTKQIGEFVWDDDAIVEMDRWFDEGCPPTPSHSRLEYYRSRRHMTTMKLAMVSAAARQSEFLITIKDVNRARDWLLDAEAVMPDIFRHMAGRSDTQVLQELHRWLWGVYNKQNKTAVHEAKIIHFLSTRLPSDKVMRLMEVAERAQLMVREFGSKEYTPKPVNQIGME